jgi:hypothetical protein
VRHQIKRDQVGILLIFAARSVKKGRELEFYPQLQFPHAWNNWIVDRPKLCLSHELRPQTCFQRIQCSCLMSRSSWVYSGGDEIEFALSFVLKTLLDSRFAIFQRIKTSTAHKTQARPSLRRQKLMIEVRLELSLWFVQLQPISVVTASPTRISIESEDPHSQAHLLQKQRPELDFSHKNVDSKAYDGLRPLQI